MRTRKILVVFGTRPEAVKMAPVCHALKARPKQFETIICDTGQHREMTGHILSRFDITPDILLNVMQPNQTLFQLTGAVLRTFEEVLRTHKPDAVLVQGDTTTAMAAALGAFYAKCAVGHVEAGLRTGEKYSPFPEEMNRKMITHLGDFHFTPTALATKNLRDEGIPAEKIWETGNTVVDALDFMLPRLKGAFSETTLKSLLPQLGSREMVLITCHRRESFGDDLRKIFSAIRQLAGLHPDMDFVYPVHLNPNVQSTAKEQLTGQKNILLIPPQPYDIFLALMNRSKLILTDSGGIQEEAYTVRKPIIILRKHTERSEAVDAGYAWLVGCESENIVRQTEEVLGGLGHGKDFFSGGNPFGDGKASERIADALEKAL